MSLVTVSRAVSVVTADMTARMARMNGTVVSTITTVNLTSSKHVIISYINSLNIYIIAVISYINSLLFFLLFLKKFSEYINSFNKLYKFSHNS